jgi:hypothetical protein
VINCYVNKIQLCQYDKCECQYWKAYGYLDPVRENKKAIRYIYELPFVIPGYFSRSHSIIKMEDREAHDSYRTLIEPILLRGAQGSFRLCL